jgi:hypothetical protein
MTTTGRKVLADFEALPPHDKQEVAVEILRRATAEGDLSEEVLNELAAEVFHGYDAEEGPREVAHAILIRRLGKLEPDELHG